MKTQMELIADVGARVRPEGTLDVNHDLFPHTSGDDARLGMCMRAIGGVYKIAADHLVRKVEQRGGDNQ